MDYLQADDLVAWKVGQWAGWMDTLMADWLEKRLVALWADN